MSILVDANVLSEPTRPEPDPRIVAWLRANEANIVVDPIILGELRFGLLLLPRGRRRQRLETWFGEGVARLHCIPWDAPTAMRWAELLAKLRSVGKAMPLKDSMIAATALRHDLRVATLNRSDFAVSGVALVEPRI